MSGNSKTTYKLSRFGALIARPGTYIWLCLLNIVLVSWLIWSNKSSVQVGIGVVVLANIFAILAMLFYFPKRLSVGGGTVEFDEYIEMKPSVPSFVRIRGGLWRLKVSYSVCQIKNVEFGQNPVEKLFDVGHVSFGGKATFTAKRDVDRIEEKDTFTIYGIKHFSKFKAEFMQH